MRKTSLGIFVILLILGCSNKTVEKKEFTKVHKSEFLIQASDIGERGEFIPSLEVYKPIIKNK